MKLSDTAREVIRLAERIEHYWDVELPKQHPDYPFIHSGTDSGPPPPERKELTNLMASLSDDDVYKLALIMYLGRGNFDTEDLAGSLEALKERFEKPGLAASQMMGKAPLADYLTDGLAALKASGVDVDNLPSASINSGH